MIGIEVPPSTGNVASDTRYVVSSSSTSVCFLFAVADGMEVARHEARELQRKMMIDDDGYEDDWDDDFASSSTGALLVD